MQMKNAKDFVDRPQNGLDTHDNVRIELEIEIAERQSKLSKPA